MVWFCFLLRGLQWRNVQGDLDLFWPSQCVLVPLVRYCDRGMHSLVGLVGVGCAGHGVVVVIWA